jgi:pectate lyase
MTTPFSYKRRSIFTMPRLFYWVVGLAIAPALASAQSLRAFPGADGAAAHVTGGRGGIIYHVTKLDESSADNAPGTLRYGLDDKNFPDQQPRTIVFDVGGRIFLGRASQEGWDPNGNGWDTSSRLTIKSNITLAGETAPAPGIVIMGGTIKPGGENIIIRHLTVAPGYGNKTFFEPGKGPPKQGDTPDSFSYDAFDISGKNIIIDHCTTVYATDETISLNEMADNITIQYCIIAQGQNYPQGDAEANGIKYTGHALGSLLQAGSNAKVSVHHNLYAHLKGRLPRVGSEKGSGAYNDFRNNVFYNWLGTAGSGARGQPSFNNFINNFYLAGPGGENATDNDSPRIVKSPGGTGIFEGYDPAVTRVYAAGNIKDLDRNEDPGDFETTTAAENERADFRRVGVEKKPFTQVPYGGPTELAIDARERVLETAGARPWDRSPIEKRIVTEVRMVQGKIVAWADDPFDDSPAEGVEWRALVDLKPSSRPADFDTDQDGMPDSWESANKLDPKSADNNGDADSDGYTNLEEYLHERAGTRP